MPEINAYPTSDELLAYRTDLSNYLASGQSLDNVMATALLEVKRYLEDKRNVMWAMVFDTIGDAYWDNEDSTGRNKDRIQKAIILYTIAIIFRDYSITVGDGAWWELYLSYRADAENTLKDARLDVDRDESGDISNSEAETLGQSFMIR
ncbi:MAG: hypothetical protein B6I36_10325 [Desulfobacteraceae bacterium 4572_35.1]|nr:MAG: hypothetical protein B6I36_10325 [Desulfobacteraceae bacterium 4572_35.1]